MAASSQMSQEFGCPLIPVCVLEFEFRVTGSLSCCRCTMEKLRLADARQKMA